MAALRGAGWTREFWLEVKAWAPESGVQIANYQRWIRDRPAGSQPALVVIAPTALAGHNDVPWIAWQSIRRASIRATTASTRWHDLATFLEEEKLADEYDEPIVAREAGSLLDAHNLYRKVTRIIHATTEVASSRWPALGWPKSQSDADMQLLWQFRERRRIVLPIRTAARTQLMLGVAQIDPSSRVHEPDPFFAVWVDHSPKQSDLRRTLLDQADAGGLATRWTRRLQGWWALAATERMGALGTHAEAVAWLVERLGDLDNAGVLALLSASDGSAMEITDEGEVSET